MRGTGKIVKSVYIFLSPHSKFSFVYVLLALLFLQVAPPSLAFGANAVGRSIPENADVFLEVTLVELGAEPIIDEEQEQWLRQNPL